MLGMMCIAHKISHGTNVVVVNNQSAKSKKNLLLLVWMLTTTTFVSWDILWTMIITHDHVSILLHFMYYFGCCVRTWSDRLMEQKQEVLFAL